jgi:hypothetical protein
MDVAILEFEGTLAALDQLQASLTEDLNQQEGCNKWLAMNDFTFL